MACYSLDFSIVSLDTLKVDEKTATLPTSKDVKVLESLYEVSAKSEAVVDTKPTYSKTGMIRYKSEAERDLAYTTMKGSIDKDVTIIKGSYAQKHTCYHDETPPKPCTVTERYEK